MDLAFYARHYGGAAWDAWLADLRGRGAARGHDLVMTLPGADAVARADKLLETAEREGVIKRGAYEPSREFQIFGVGGRAGGPLSKNAPRFPVEFTWVPA